MFRIGLIIKILIVGFPRSGTSLTHRIFNKHPQVQKMLFEKNLLRNFKSRKDISNRYPWFASAIACGEKVTYAKRVVGKIGRSKYTIVDYCKDWIKMFGDEARIIHLIRHPYDSLNSLKKSKKRFPRGPSIQSVYKEYLKGYIAKYSKQISRLPNCWVLKYENLVQNSWTIIPQMYADCGLDYNFKFPEKMKTGRIFNYKQKGFTLPPDKRLKKAIDVYNQYGEPIYEY